MPEIVKIGNASGFWGDSVDAPARLVQQAPDMGYLTLDYLAEVSLSIMAAQRTKNPDMGYARDFVDTVKSLVPLWRNGAKTRIVTNAGGLNPLGCGEACVEVLREAGLTKKKVGIVLGDDVLPIIQDSMSEEQKIFTNLDNGMPISTVMDRLVTANAYAGAQGAAEALARGADIVVTGRMADPSMAVAAAVHHFGWAWDDFDRIASATVVGHLLECGSQVCGGISTEWLELPNLVDMGFPVCEVAEDGSFVVTMPEGSGGAVNERTVKEQIMYEIGDPGNYLSPDCTLSFLTLEVKEIGPNRVRVTNATGRKPSGALKVSATYTDGYRATGQLTIFGHRAVAKARKSGEIILERLRKTGYTFARSNIECLGAGACAPDVFEEPELLETVLRLSVHDENRDAVERFTKELSPLACGGAQGTTGYAGGRPRVSPVFGFWPCLIERERVPLTVEIL